MLINKIWYLANRTKTTELISDYIGTNVRANSDQLSQEQQWGWYSVTWLWFCDLSQEMRLQSDIDDAYDNHDYLFFIVSGSISYFYILIIRYLIKCKWNQWAAAVFRQAVCQWNL